VDNKKFSAKSFATLCRVDGAFKLF